MASPTMRTVKHEKVHVLFSPEQGGPRQGTLWAVDEVNHKCRVDIDGVRHVLPLGNVQRQTTRTAGTDTWYAAQTKSGHWAVFTLSGSYNIGDSTAPHGEAGAKRNATLAATAPELLAALAKFLPAAESALKALDVYPEPVCTDDLHDALVNARNAINKAGGAL